MNDIEILKDLNKYISFANKHENFSNDADYKWHKELAGMIENLIQENKELEENLKIATAMLTKGTYPEQNEGDNDFCKQFIPKSKVKEIKEKIHNLLDNNGIIRAYQLEIDKYFEDLEEGE